MNDTHPKFNGSIPELYDAYLGPFYFEIYDADPSQRVSLRDGREAIDPALDGLPLEEEANAPKGRIECDAPCSLSRPKEVPIASISPFTAHHTAYGIYQQILAFIPGVSLVFGL